MDIEKLKQISELIRLVDKTESDYFNVSGLIKNIENINATYHEDNILKIICQGYCKTIATDENGNQKQIFDKRDFDYRKDFIDLCINKGVDRDLKFGRYKAPLLFFVEDEYLFEYLCSIGFDPNERLITSGFEGRPYFSLHHDFQINIYHIALKYGFDKTQKTLDNQEIIHLIFKRFIEFETSTIEKLSEAFENSKNIPSIEGLTCLQHYILGCDPSNYMIQNLKKMIELGFDKNFKTEMTIEISEYTFPKGSTAFDIFKTKCKGFNFDKKLSSIAENILQPDRQVESRKWWKF
jgi:hypothetical protein